MQDPLFPDTGEAPAGPAPRRETARRSAKVQPAAHGPALAELAAALPAPLRLGTSSWTYPGWVGLVWDREYPDATLSRHGLAAYAQHPLLRTVTIDRGFYRPLTATQFAAYAAQVPDDFRFVVKAPAGVTDATLRDESGHALQLNPGFLDADAALCSFVEPALQGLGRKLGALVFQISPLPPVGPARLPEWIDFLYRLLRAIPDLRSTAPDAVVAVEVRDAEWLTPRFIDALRDAGATYCIGLHAKMPRIAEQLPVLRALWPGPLVCRWNLNPLHGAYGYEARAGSTRRTTASSTPTYRRASRWRG